MAMDNVSHGDPLFLPMAAALIGGALAARVARRWERAFDNWMPRPARALIGCISVVLCVVGLGITIALIQ